MQKYCLACKRQICLKVVKKSFDKYSCNWTYAETGRFTMVKVSMKTVDKGIRVYPNPVHGNAINLFLKNIAKGKYRLRLINTSGQTVYENNILHKGGSGSQVIELKRLPAKGSYQLEMFSDVTLESISILVPE